MKKEKKFIYRSVKTGRFVSKKYAERYPSSTVKEKRV